MAVTLILLLLTVGASAGTWLLSGISAWWLLLLLPGWYVAISTLYLLILLIASLCLPKKEPEHPNVFCQVLIRLTLEWMMMHMRVHITLRGTKLLPDCPCVFVSNHRSDFDPMTALTVIHDRKIAYISKEANFKIPLVGPFIRRAGSLAIDRENGMRAIRTLKKAADMMNAEQMSMGIYPEGTRSKTGELLEFKTGAFYLAKKADAPIAVMLTRGTESISKNTPLKRTNVDLCVVKVIDRETVRATSLEDLSAMVREIVAQGLNAEETKQTEK